MLVAAMNPCPCGYSSDPIHPCVCSEHEKQRYLSKISGPLLDRIDIAVNVDPVDCELIIKERSKTGAESSASIRARVVKAREIQLRRFKDTKTECNAGMTPAETEHFCAEFLSASAKELLISAYKQLHFSARINNKILKTARTIADLDASEYITDAHIAEAIQYRSVDRIVALAH